MLKRRRVAIICCVLLIILVACPFYFVVCHYPYNSKEVEEIKSTFRSFNNNENFAFNDDDCIWLYDKTIYFDDLEYQGATIDKAIACGDEYFYAITNRVKQSTGYYELKILKVNYNTLEMQEIGSISNLLKIVNSSCRLYNNKIYIRDDVRYCVYDLTTGSQEWFTYDNDLFWTNDENGKYKFIVKDKVVTVTEKETDATKNIFWSDLSSFVEGRYILQVDSKLKFTKSFFQSCLEKDGKIYLLGLIPLDYFVLYYQAFILVYDFDTETIEYYSSSVISSGFAPIPRLSIVKR